MISFPPNPLMLDLPLSKFSLLQFLPKLFPHPGKVKGNTSVLRLMSEQRSVSKTALD